MKKNIFLYQGKRKIYNNADLGKMDYLSLYCNLGRLHRSKNNHRKIIVIEQIIGSGQIDSFVCIESIIYSKSTNNRFLDRKGTKTNNNPNIIGLNRKGRLKHMEK